MPLTGLKWWNLYLIVFMTAAVFALVLTPLFRLLAVKFEFFDIPKKQLHKTHKTPTPLLGGVAICVTWILTVLIGFLSVRFIESKQLHFTVMKYFPSIRGMSHEIIFICLGSFLAMLLGLWDDCYNMSARVKLLGQIIIAVMAVSLGGVRVSCFINQPVIVWCVSVFWILVIFNAINFFDNMDGLAVGTAAIALSFFTIAAAVNEQYFVASLAASTAGAAIGFWFYNHSPATMFMGDSGSHFLGYVLAVIGARVTFYNPVLSTTRFPILIPLFILAIPLFDMLAVVVIRWRIKKPVYIGDNNHISHRFVKMGMSRPKAVLMVHLLELIIGLSVLPLIWGDERTTVIALVQACTILLLISLLQYQKEETPQANP